MGNYNVHSHSFTMDNAPEHFLNLYLPGFAANAIDKITNTQAGSKIFEKLLSTFGGNGGKRYASFLSIGKSKSQMDVFEHLMAQYDDPNIKFVVLTMNMEYCGAGNSVSGFEGQLEEMLEVKRRYPDRVLLFLGLDPRWKQDGRALKNTVKAYFDQKLVINATTSVNPFAGLKLYPSTGFYPFDENLKETFEWAAENEVPVLSHCYYLGGIYKNDADALKSTLNPMNPYSGMKYDKPEYLTGKSFFKWILGQNKSNNNRNTCSYFLEPAAVEDMLKYFETLAKPLKFCLAHYGGAEQMLISHGKRKPNDIEANPYGIKTKNWYEQIKDLMIQNPNCTYADIAYTVYDKDVFPCVFQDLNDPAYSKKIMFGTDYFLTEQQQPETTTYHQFRDAAMNAVNTISGNSQWQQIAQDNTGAFLKSKYYP